MTTRSIPSLARRYGRRVGVLAGVCALVGVAWAGAPDTVPLPWEWITLVAVGLLPGWLFTRRALG